MVQTPTPHCVVKQEPTDEDPVTGMASSQLSAVNQHHPTDTSGTVSSIFSSLYLRLYLLVKYGLKP